MKFHINKQSEITAHDQLREQIIFFIGTGELAIGKEMPSVRGLARQLEINLNTVSKVYRELVRGGWLVERPGAHHMVVERDSATKPLMPTSDLDKLIDHIIDLAQTHGYSLQRLTAHLRRRLLEQPPDHLLIVETERGMGEIMKQEISRNIGYSPPSCDLRLLQQNPALGIGAILIAPAYVVDKLGQSLANRRRVIPVSYSPSNKLILAISRLSQPSMIGWVSVSRAGLITMSGIAAPIIGSQHSNHFFLMERLNSKAADRFRLRRYRREEYQSANILAAARKVPEPEFPTDESAITHDDEEIVSAEDLRCVDLLFCDSITSCLIDHPNRVHYELLSQDSLEKVKAAAATLPQPNVIGARTL